MRGDVGTALEAGRDSSSKVDLRGAVRKGSFQPHFFFLVTRCLEWIPLRTLLDKGGERVGSLIRLLQDQTFGIPSSYDLGVGRNPSCKW